jgi:HCOMODA/2-hydroxy-3-carboxy-muconic semialdehyde decarboxylase
MSQIEDLVAAYRILAEHDVIDAYGHVSVRSERDPNRYFLAGHIAPENVTEEHIIEYDLDSNPIDPKGRRIGALSALSTARCSRRGRK